MSIRARIGGVARALCVLLAEVVLIQTWPVPVRAQEQEPAKLNISILEGEGSINNIRQRVAREAMVQVDDENHKPVAGSGGYVLSCPNTAPAVCSRMAATASP